MAISMQELTSDQRDTILGVEEDHFADVKRIEIRPAKLTETLSAFANADGGDLYVGIAFDKETGRRFWKGFDNVEAANGHLQCFEDFFPLGQHVRYGFLQCEEEVGLVLHADIRKSQDMKKASDGVHYVRRGAQNLPQTTPEAVERLRFNKGLTSFEDQTISGPDLASITNSAAIINFMLKIVPSPEPEPWLKSQQLIHDGKVTVGGILLFADEPQAILPKRSAIKIYRYKTSDAEGSRAALDSDPITIEGCLYDQIKSGVEKTVEIVGETSVLGSEDFERVEYPSAALHEIITNAVLHRDYSIPDDVHVRIFDNRIEVESPGTLPGHITVENILDEQFARNGRIVRMINKFPDPPNKDVGEGLNTAFKAMREQRLKPPMIQTGEHSVVVYIRHEPLASYEEIIMAYFDKHREINNSKAREICHEGSENVIKRRFQHLMESGLIERVPGKKGRASAYRKSRQQIAGTGAPEQIRFSYD